jgi:hypothetical protein
MSRTHDVTISAFDLDRIEAELTAVTEQRDRLAEAFESIICDSDCDCHTCQVAREALAAVKSQPTKS